MSNELTAVQLIRFIRTVNRLSKDDVRLIFQNWLANPLKDSVELYISNDWGHDNWNDEIKEYLESLGFSINIEYDENYESGMTITIGINDDSYRKYYTNPASIKEVHESKVIAIYTGSKHYCISKDEIAYINFDTSELSFVMMLKTSGLCKIVFDNLDMFKHHFEQVCEELNINNRYFKSSMFVRNGEL